MSRKRWMTPGAAARELGIGVSTVRRWVDAYIAWCGEIGVDPSSPDAPPVPTGMDALRGWTLPVRRGTGHVRAIDPADVERMARLLRAGGDAP